jgi:hypothetical protein
VPGDKRPPIAGRDHRICFVDDIASSKVLFPSLLEIPPYFHGERFEGRLASYQVATIYSFG